MHKFNIGDTVKDNGKPARVVELPIHRPNHWDGHYLVQFENKIYGHDGLGAAKKAGDGYHWVEEYEITLIARGLPPTELEKSLLLYIEQEFEELGLS